MLNTRMMKRMTSPFKEIRSNLKNSKKFVTNVHYKEDYFWIRCRTTPTLYKCELCPKMYILQGAYKTHLKSEHDIGIYTAPNPVKTPPKKCKTAKTEMACQYCFKKYTSSNLLEKHVKVHGKYHVDNVFFSRIFFPPFFWELFCWTHS